MDGITEVGTKACAKCFKLIEVGQNWERDLTDLTRYGYQHIPPCQYRWHLTLSFLLKLHRDSYR